MKSSSKLDAQELFLIRDASIRHFVNLPLRCRLPGMDRDLTEEERRTIAYLEASIESLNRMGCIDQTELEFANIRVFNHTTTHHVIDEEMENAASVLGK